MISIIFRQQTIRFLTTCSRKSMISIGGITSRTLSETWFDNIRPYQIGSNQYSTYPPKKLEERKRINLNRQKMPPFPQMEMLVELKVESFLASNFNKVKYGDYEFTECKEGFVHIYVQAFRNERTKNQPSGYAIYFGENHPLNVYGPIVGRQELCHAKLYGVLQAFKMLPKNLFQKVCFCVDDLSLISFVTRHLKSMSENDFRSTYSGNINKDLITNMELNRLIRLSDENLKIRFKYSPSDVGQHEIYMTGKLAEKGAEMAKNKINSRW